MLKRGFLVLSIMFLGMTGCLDKKGDLGSADNPVKLFFVPSVDANLIADKSKIVKKYLEEHTPYKYDIRVPSSYVAVVEAFGTNRADVAALNTFGYIMAHEKYGVQAMITLIRHGQAKYRSQIVARADSSVKKVADLNGKKFAYVDPASTSGYLLPAKMFLDRNIKPSETVFAQKHDNVITMVYQKQVDAGATFYSPPSPRGVEDARRLVKTQYPDIEKEVVIVELTDEIPNDPIVIRKTLPEDMKKIIQSAFIDFIATPEGKAAFNDLYGADSFITTTDKEYDSVREILKSLGKSASSLVK
ncbi:MAG: phosphate/phosphite/phosphonate ABC transporter substrate-binding protein [Bdellovibrionales bacterium]|nr:phosphate/phosphite/phosphonate ABC transporter substrate-binding protein [Bdellovibrionales bacterium]